MKYVFSFDSGWDSDWDGLSDWHEVELGTDPYNPDTDGDGLGDGWEFENGKDPLDDGDANPDAMADLREAARQRIIRHHLLVYGVAPVFTNLPGSASDLQDLRNNLNALSGLFYKKN